MIERDNINKDKLTDDEWYKLHKQRKEDDSVSNRRSPLGLRPKWAAEQERFFEVCNAISRYWQAGFKIPIEFIEEYNELVIKVKPKS